MSDSPFARELNLQEWENIYWKREPGFVPGFHRDSVNQDLVKFYDKLIVKEASRVFVPLCGKSLDIPWLAEKGHDVVGNEFSDIAVKQIFTENNLEFTVEETKDFSIYKAVDKKITIYRGDFFKLSKDLIGDFDAIWDRASFVAINVDKRLEYTDLMFSLMKPSTNYLLETVSYDGTRYAGPPHYVTESSLDETFGRKLTMEKYEGASKLGPKSAPADLIFTWTIYTMKFK